MEAFLKIIADHYYLTYEDNIDNCCFVFPNRRSSLFFKKHLASSCSKPLFAPDCMTINELFGKLSNIKPTDSLGLIFSLYNNYIKLSGSNEAFDEFYSWGETLLSDFNDIDKYLIDAEQLFSNLYELKSIDSTFDYLSPTQLAAIKRFWKDFEEDKYTGSRENFLQSWLILAPLYKALQKELLDNGQGYEGMIYRDIDNRIKNGTLNLPHYKRYIFVGLNALNECEKNLLKHLKNLDIADFHWDYSSDYIKDVQNQAGFFIRENIALFPQSPKLDFPCYNSPAFESIAIPSNTGQTKIINQALKEKGIATTQELEHTAIILSDEQLMIPTLHALPEGIESHNITMGYPLKATSIYALFSQLLNLQKNIRQSENSYTFYHKNVMAILHHSFINRHFTEACQQLVTDLTTRNSIYTEAETLGTAPLFKLIFKGIDSPADFPSYLKDIFAYCIELHKTDEEEDNTINDEKLEKEFLYHLYINISRFDDLLKENDIIPGIDVLARLLRKHIDSIAIPFYGEPLKGLQIMGILETRALDFENLIFLSFNEGIFPKAAPVNSFIPHNLRYGFGLPTIEHQDAIFAYYFYRIIQRAKNVWMIYDSSSAGMKQGEISRYSSQLKYIYDEDIKERIQTYQVKLKAPQAITIKKDNKVMKKLNRYLKDGEKALSASALNNYIDCPLKFYFHKVEDINETDELKEDIDSNSFGTIFHSVIEHLYAPYENATITKEILYKISRNDHEIEKQIDLAFAKEYFKSEQVIELKGRHLIIGRIIKKYAKQLLRIDMEQAPFTYRKGEQKVECSLPLSNNKEVKFIGYIDRIDEINGKTRIIDYKTGKGKVMKFMDISSLTVDDKNRPAPIFQTFFYAWMTAQTKGIKNIIPNVYFIRDLFKGFDPGIKHDKQLVEDFEPYYEEYESKLKELLEELYNPEISFKQTENQDKCRYCYYKGICMK